MGRRFGHKKQNISQSNKIALIPGNLKPFSLHGLNLGSVTPQRGQISILGAGTVKHQKAIPIRGLGRRKIAPKSQVVACGVGGQRRTHRQYQKRLVSHPENQGFTSKYGPRVAQTHVAAGPQFTQFLLTLLPSNRPTLQLFSE